MEFVQTSLLRRTTPNVSVVPRYNFIVSKQYGQLYMASLLYLFCVNRRLPKCVTIVTSREQAFFDGILKIFKEKTGHLSLDFTNKFP